MPDAIGKEIVHGYRVPSRAFQSRKGIRKAAVSVCSCVLINIQPFMLCFIRARVLSRTFSEACCARYLLPHRAQTTRSAQLAPFRHREILPPGCTSSPQTTFAASLPQVSWGHTPGRPFGLTSMEKHFEKMAEVYHPHWAVLYTTCIVFYLCILRSESLSWKKL